MPNVPNEEKVDDLVAMLDKLMSDGGGHINVKVEDDGELEMHVETTNSTDCSLNKGACAQPTEFFDEDE